MPKLYGIKNCDSVKKARTWLDNNKVDYVFHDFRADGLTSAQAEKWLAHLGWEQLINRRSTSWKALDADQRARMDTPNALAAILDNPTLIKRPLLEMGDDVRVGFRASDYTKIFTP